MVIHFLQLFVPNPSDLVGAIALPLLRGVLVLYVVVLVFGRVCSALRTGGRDGACCYEIGAATDGFVAICAAPIRSVITLDRRRAFNAERRVCDSDVRLKKPPFGQTPTLSPSEVFSFFHGSVVAYQGYNLSHHLL